MRRLRAGLLVGTALVAVAWFTPERNAAGEQIGWVLRTEGAVYKNLREGGRRDFIISVTVVFLTATPGSNQTWTRPGDFPGTADKVETPAGGGGGAGGDTDGKSGGGNGGGGGAYSSILNLVLSSNPTYQIGIGGTAGPSQTAGGDGGDTWFNGTTLGGSSVGAKGGQGGQLFAGGTGGQSSGGVGGTKRSGGNGGVEALGQLSGGGGGAAGPTGAGGAGDDGDGVGFFSGKGGTADTGGTGAGVGGAKVAGGNGNPGGAGTEFDGSHGCGGGGSGAANDHVAFTLFGGDGGNYGGAGGGGASSDSGGVGKQGLIVITYTPSGGATAFPFSATSFQHMLVR